MLFDKGDGKRPILLTLLSLFYVVATVMAFAVVVLRLTGNDVELPFEVSTAWLAIEGLIFLFMAYGLSKGWVAAWLVALVMNVAWIVMDSRNFLLGNTGALMPILIAAVSIVVLFLPGSRGYCRIGLPKVGKKSS